MSSRRVGEVLSNSELMKHPYVEFENCEIWKVVESAIDDLVRNQDIKLTTSRDHVVGYLCRKIAARRNEVEGGEESSK